MRFSGHQSANRIAGRIGSNFSNHKIALVFNVEKVEIVHIILNENRMPQTAFEVENRSRPAGFHLFGLKNPLLTAGC